MNKYLYCPIVVDGEECNNRIAKIQYGKFRPYFIDVRCDKCGKFLHYSYKTKEFTVKPHPLVQDSSGRRIY